MDVELLLSSLTTRETRIGEWLNVIGYIAAKPLSYRIYHSESVTPVQAIVLWSCGPFRLEQYEGVMDQLKQDAATS